MTADQIETTHKRHEEGAGCRIAIQVARILSEDLARFVRACEAGNFVVDSTSAEPYGSFAIGRVVVADARLAKREIGPGDRVAVHRSDLGPKAGSMWCHRFDVPAGAIRLVPKEGGLSLAVLLPELALALRAIRASSATAGDRVAVFGLCTAGLCAVQALKSNGVRWIAAVDADPTMQARAHMLGADIALDPVAFEHFATADPERAADKTICFTPDSGLFARAIRSTNHLGTVVIAGSVLKQALVIPDYYREIIIKEMTIVGAYRPTEQDWESAATMLSAGIVQAPSEYSEIAVDAKLVDRLRGLAKAGLGPGQTFLVFG